MKFYNLVLLVLLSMYSVMAQNQFNIGTSVGIPIGDSNNFASMALVADLSYQFQMSEYFKLGAFTGYSYSFGKTIDNVRAVDVQFVPIGAAARYELLPKIHLGLDTGYAFNTNDVGNVGFYFSPRFQYQLAEQWDLVFAYRGITRDGSSWDMISAGVEFKIK